jgi:hypothetical protein
MFMRRLPAIIYFAVVCLALADTHYVSLDGANNSPYTNWPDAATNIQWAVTAAVAGDTVLVSNGTYVLTNEIAISSALTVTSVNGKEVTIVDGNFPVTTNRCFKINAAATLNGFMVTNGCTTNNGGGIYLATGTVQNCLIAGNWQTNGTTNAATGGGGIYVTGIGSVLNCTVRGNKSHQACNSYFYGGGGIYLASGVVSGCVVSANIATNNMNAGDAKSGGGGVNMASAGILRNSTINNNFSYTYAGGVMCGLGQIYRCVIVSNTAVTPFRGGGVLMEGGILDDCLIAYNNSIGGAAYYTTCFIRNCTYTRNVGVGITCYNLSKIENTISYHNGGASYSLLGAGDPTFSNSCVSVMPTNSLSVNNITNAPLFVDTNTANYRLQSGSPCINAGVNRAWMTGVTDLDGRSRIDRFSRVVDMGAYEYLRAGTIFSAK